MYSVNQTNPLYDPVYFEDDDCACAGGSKICGCDPSTWLNCDIKAPTAAGYRWALNPNTKECEQVAITTMQTVTPITAVPATTPTAANPLAAIPANYKPLLVLGAVLAGLYFLTKD